MTEALSIDVTTLESTAGPVPAIEFDHRQAPKPVGTYFATYDELRENEPFYRVDVQHGWWLLTRADIIREAYQRTDLFSNSAVIVNDPNPAYKWIPEMLDPPEHTRWRQLLAPIFSPKAVAKLEPRVRQRCVELIDELAPRGETDFLQDFARRYPTTIFLELMGLPVTDLETFMGWEDMILHTPGSTPEGAQRRLDGMTATNSYFEDVIADRRRHPREDIVSHVVSSELDGTPIPDDDVTAMCLLLFIAGLDTVAMQLCWSFLHLATHPADRERILTEPEIIPLATEELLRAFAFVVPSRKVVKDEVFHGCPMKAGDMVLLPLCAATRDPRQFEEPSDIVIDRHPNPHIAFGAGPHRCLGSYLARQELHVAFDEWHRRIPSYRLADGASDRMTEHGGQIGLDSLPLVWEPSAS